MKVFIAGATGAIGLPLVRVLRMLGHEVTGMTRNGPGVALLRELGAKASIADAFDAASVHAAIKAAAPDVVIDQLTWLPANPADIIKAMPDDNRLHKEGGANLLAAAKALGVRRYIMQSRGFFLDTQPGTLADERAEFRGNAPGVVGEGARIFAQYEKDVMQSGPLEGVVLRYGFFYGPGTWYRPEGAIAEQARNGQMAIIGAGNAVWSFVHIDDAIAATVAALTSEPGVYNVVDDNPVAVADWMPAFSRWVNAPAPARVSVEEARSAFGEAAVFYHTVLTGASNKKAKEKLGFNPRPLLWKDA